MLDRQTFELTKPLISASTNTNDKTNSFNPVKSKIKKICMEEKMFG